MLGQERVERRVERSRGGSLDDRGQVLLRPDSQRRRTMLTDIVVGSGLNRLADEYRGLL